MITEYPSGLVILCLLLGAAYSLFLYFHDIRRGMRPVVIWSMTALRFFSVTIIAFLILSPMIKRTEKRVEKPLIVIGIDNSGSMVLTADSGYYRSKFPVEIQSLASELGQKCEVKLYSFSERLKPGFTGDFKGTKTDISSFFTEVNTRYANRNAAAVILVSDGIYNEGTDPWYAAQKITFPVYTIALGDTTVKKDVFIRKITVNKTAYKGDKFPVEVLVEMDKCNGSTTKLTVSKGTQLLDSKEIRVNGDRSVQKATFILEAKESGMTRYTLRLSEVKGEGSMQNNQSGFIVEVLDVRQKIALVTTSPHPDVTAIRKALEGSSHFEVEQMGADELPRTFEKYDLVILNQLPSITSVTDFTALQKSKVSLLYILGTQTDVNAFNRMQTGLIINASKNAFTESQPAINPDFSLFTMDNRDAADFKEFPPLQSPFGLYQASPMTEVFCYQKIGNIATRTPLILFPRVMDRKIGIIAGENIWRWRIADFIKQANHESFDVWMDKVAQYLSTREDKSFFRIQVKNRIFENEPLEFEAQLFNASYEMTNQPGVNLTLTDKDQKSYPYLFSKTQKSYYLNAGMFPEGEYSYTATVKSGNSLYQKTGKLYIEPVNIENSNLVADHNLLFRIASAHEGEMVFKDNIRSLAAKILARQDIHSVSVFQKRMSDLIGTPWLFALIILLLTAEWVLRKREGL